MRSFLSVTKKNHQYASKFNAGTGEQNNRRKFDVTCKYPRCVIETYLRIKDGLSPVSVKGVSRPLPDLQMNLLIRAFSSADQMSSSLYSLFGSRFSLTEPLNMVGF